MFIKKMRVCGVVALISAVCFGCTADKQEHYSYMTTFAMNTIISFTIDMPNGEEEIIFSDAEKIIRGYENMLSVNVEDSDIYKINNSDLGEKISISDKTMEILKVAEEFEDLTDGDFSISVAPLVTLWGFTQDIEQTVPSYEDIEKTLELVDMKDVIIDEDNNTIEFLKDGMAIDLGAIAKGYIAEELTNYFRDSGVLNGHFTIGGNISTMGLKNDGSKWKIAVQNPVDINDYVGLLEVTDLFVVTSGGYQRYFTEDNVRYHHIIDPKTGYPSDSDLLSVTIISDNGAEADILSTALFVMGLDKSLEYWEEHRNFEAVFITEDEVIVTDGAKAIFTFEGQDNDFEYRD